MVMLDHCKMLLLVPAMVVAMPVSGQDKALDTAMVVELEGETVNMLDAIVQLMQGGGEFDRQDETCFFFYSNMHLLVQVLLVQAEHLHELHLP